MEDRLEVLISIVRERFNPYVDVASKIAKTVNADLNGFMKQNYRTLELLSKSLNEDEVCKDMFVIPFKYTSEGIESVTKRMGIGYNQFNMHLGRQTENHQDLVGFYDGYLQQYLGTHTTRLPFSLKYDSGVNFGKKVGSESKFWLFAQKSEITQRINPEKLFTLGKEYLGRVKSS